MGPRNGPGPRGRMPGRPPEKVKDFKGTFKRLLGYLKPNMASLIFALAALLIGTIASIVTPFILGLATTELYDGSVKAIQGTGGINLIYVRNILLVSLGLIIVSQAFSFVHTFFLESCTNKTMYRLRRDVDQKINRLPLNYFDTKTHGEILSRITNDVDSISGSLGQVISQVISSVFTVVLTLVIMIKINLWLTLISLLVVPLSLLVSKKVIGKSQKYFIGNQTALGDLNGHVEEMYSGHNVIKLFNREEKTIDEFNVLNGRLYDYSRKSQFYSSLMMPLTQFLGNVGYILTAVIGGFFAIGGNITVGNIQALLNYTRHFMQPISQLAQISNVLQSTVAAAERVFEVLDETEEPKNSETPIKLQEVRGDVSFENVRFGYTEDKTLITDLNLDIKSGQTVAIVGPTGAGKTTIINLLMRFYDVNGGSIKIDGVDIRDMKRDDLRDIFGMVLQDTWLFNGTIRDNIAYGAKDAPTEQDVIKAAKLACADHFIRTLPNGYDMVLNEEASNVSGGQKQLLTIARAILSDPSVLILDEATSAVDTRTEQLIQKAMNNLMKGRTSFVIAHRLSTIKDSDVILVLNDGDIVEKGNHEELMAKGGFYYELYNSQFASKAS